jgi:hypothetical protein
MVEASLGDLIRVHYIAQYFAANTVVVDVTTVTTITTTK